LERARNGTVERGWDGEADSRQIIEKGIRGGDGTCVADANDLLRTGVNAMHGQARTNFHQCLVLRMVRLYDTAQFLPENETASRAV
jgi:hypothetical protein